MEAEYTCPRCERQVTQRFYGPCSSCRDELGATMRIDNAGGDVAEYEPKMNVVPNQIATKE